jgi:hypothetical protein
MSITFDLFVHQEWERFFDKHPDYSEKEMLEFLHREWRWSPPEIKAQYKKRKSPLYISKTRKQNKKSKNTMQRHTWEEKGKDRC